MAQGNPSSYNTSALAAPAAGPTLGPAKARPEAAGLMLAEGVRRERDGSIEEAAERYRVSIELAEAAGDYAVAAEALRRLGVLHHRRNDPDTAQNLCRRSHELAAAHGEHTLAAEALNGMGGFLLDAGALEQAEAAFHQALEAGQGSDPIRARVEQNLGILANIRGDLPEASARYRSSLEAHQRLGDNRGCAIAYHNLGMVSADQKHWDEADRYFRQSHFLAEATNDTHLRGLCLLNHAEVHLACQRYDDARRSAEGALVVFDDLGSHLDKSDAYKMLGVVYRTVGRTALAESRLRTAIELAASTGSVLSQAEATRELALLYQQVGRNQDALQLLTGCHQLFSRLDARVDLVDVAAKARELEETYLAVVRDWGQSIELADEYTHGHCERVADYGLAVARALKLDAMTQTTIRLGAYLHDLGKVRVPHEILNKPGPLTPAEFETIKQHPTWGLELLEGIDFPWDIRPIIGSHHEKWDGSGYPKGLKGDAIPIEAQIICAVDVFDALTTNRSYRSALPRSEALAQMEECRRWWRPDVYQAFLQAFAA
jgi:putative nucleotidyltransferase with HDIG domain